MSLPELDRGDRQGQGMALDRLLEHGCKIGPVQERLNQPGEVISGAGESAKGTLEFGWNLGG
jgi:hypothetical protein